MKVKTGDQVIVRVGKDRGRRGKVMRIFSREGKVLVSGLNVYKRHKKSQTGGSGEIVEVPRPLDAGKVAVWCSTCEKGVKVGYLVSKMGEKERVCKKCKGVLKS